MGYDFIEIEKKWQKRWEEKKIFESNPDKRKKFFVTFPYPYINGYSHIGHLYTLARVEAFARYKRLKGYNVLFPQGWHVTGSPLVAAAQRVKDKEEKQIKILEDMGIIKSNIKKFEDAKYWIEFFAPEFKKDYISMGLSIDWRRNFITSSFNPYYDKFIKWQFRKLKEKGYVEKGSHPVVWDTKTNMPVGDHDRIEGEGETPQEFILFKFKLDDGKYVVTATLRHDTVMGITNVFANPDVTYVQVKVNGEIWIVGESIVEKLKNQNFDVNLLGKVHGKNLIGKKVESYGGKKILILPASFLDSKYGTGMVHSVPSDSADDLIALRDLQKDEALMKKYKLSVDEVKDIEPIEIFETPGIGGNSAQYFLNKSGVKSQNERDKLEKIKKELYKLTFTKGKFNKLYKTGFSEDLQGRSIPEGQKIIKKDLLKKGIIEIFYELTGRVVSRSLNECVVKIVSDQWFLKYSDEKWKKQVHEALNDIKLYPEKSREQFEYVIDWLNDWACTREYGIGTKLPFDNKWVIESLSDSTIYMAYYTISHLITNLNITEVNDEFFDYVFLGKGKGKKSWQKMKREFEYWYPLDFRNSGKDLIQNHLIFFLFNHIAIFPKKYWPRGIGVNGWVRINNQKMSKSLGNFILLRDMAFKFGADASRLTILNGGESLDDPNFDTTFAATLDSKFKNILEVIYENYGKGRKDKRITDGWAESLLNRYILDAETFMENTLFRSAIQKIFFDVGNLLKDYLIKTGNKPHKEIFKNIVDSFIIMLCPFTPHLCEEIWEKTGHKNFILLESWPKADKKKINEELEKKERLIDSLIVDINHVMGFVREKEKKTFRKGYLYVLPKEKKNYEDATQLINIKTGLEIVIFSANDKNKYDPENKSKKTKSGRPAIYLE